MLAECGLMDDDGCGGDHEARSKLCTARGREVDWIEKLRKATPALYPEAKETKETKETTQVQDTRRTPGSQPGQLSQSFRQGPEEEWSEVVRNGKKRKVFIPLPARSPSSISETLIDSPEDT